MASKKRHMIRGGTDQEDASILKLGDEFENAQCLYISEVRIILEAQQDSKDNGTDNRATTSVMSKTLDYVRAFSRFSNIESVREVRQVLGKENLSQFEVAQIANLCCEDAEEAKALIPSLENKVEAPELQEMLSQMLTIKKFQG
ncbi:HRDC-like protein [Choanephora cucurbitarum]|uniref:DNA-directed RNA polymerase II subunit RPB4 n=1 Tax=Choanephora cucurbitarum TaxID=101091 RepID=A0A1C7N1Z4_9FUNG|nr:HRDC-like protein [Choanephora cucurbitarum]OBZ82649.1 DNA-directed RNA polymerase II subunit RPB4 [Choanephora cucurbitarum]